MLTEEDGVDDDGDQRRDERYHHRFGRFDSTQKPIIKPKSCDRSKQREIDNAEHRGKRPVKIHRIAFGRKAVADDEGKSADHLRKQHPGRMDVAAACLYKDGGLSRAVRPNNNSGTSVKCVSRIDVELFVKNDRDADNAEADSDDLDLRHRLVRQKEPGQDEAEDSYHRLEHRGEARRDVLFAPKDGAVIESELEDARQSDQSPLMRTGWQRDLSNADYDENNDSSEQEADRRETDRREVAEPDLDEDPGRSPYQAKQQPDEYVHAAFRLTALIKTQ